ncbi:hypothetical protein Tsubulata_047405, partial [Turnera subulata]
EVKMLLQNLVSVPIEADLSFGSNYGRQDFLSRWGSEESSQNSKHLKDGSDPLVATDSRDVPGSKDTFKRRRLQKTTSVIVILDDDDQPDADEQSSPLLDSSSSAKCSSGYGLQCNVSTPIERCKRDPHVLDKSKKDCENFSVSGSGAGIGSRSLSSETIGSNLTECSNPELDRSGDDLGLRDFCVSVLRNHGLLSGDRPMNGCPPPIEVLGSGKLDNFLQSCEVCGDIENTANMLLCDRCEEAFHVSCCHQKADMLSDEWFCQSCSRLDDKFVLETSSLKSQNIRWWDAAVKFHMSPIERMLRYPEPYVSRVRIGESFQAVVPDWSDQAAAPRAPLSEVQTDHWDCSCAVLWDPSHSDCAVPQELETDQVLLQLKHVEQTK